jgi:F0F1-type ATP synthase membrane subunit c/vacuolar-type H+-ATPase subunit K
MFGGAMMGLLINKFVKVTQDNLDHFYIMIIIEILMRFIPLFALKLVPLEAQVQQE